MGPPPANGAPPDAPAPVNCIRLTSLLLWVTAVGLLAVLSRPDQLEALRWVELQVPPAPQQVGRRQPLMEGRRPSFLRLSAALPRPTPAAHLRPTASAWRGPPWGTAALAAAAVPALALGLGLARWPVTGRGDRRPTRGLQEMTSSFSTAASLGASAVPQPPYSPCVVVIGGAGRVGGSTVRHLLQFAAEEGWAPRVVVAGRSAAAFLQAQARWRRQSSSAQLLSLIDAVQFTEADAAGDASLDALLEALRPDLVVHTAGPFQGQPRPIPLEACLRHGVPRYVDVCDDIHLCAVARETLDRKARAAGATCAIAAGVWPGVSNLMAAECVEALRQATTDPTPGAGRAVVYDFYTAGTGGAGAAVLAATFLLLAEDATVVRAGRPAGAPPYAPKPADLGGPTADFGPRLGPKPVFRLNLLEPVATAETCAGVTDAECFFGTDPPVWNALMGAAARLVPRPVLANRPAMQALARLSAPVVKAVDALVGDATNAMRVTVTQGDQKAEAVFVHPCLEDCVGASTAAFCLHLLNPARQADRPAGVLYPDEVCRTAEERAAVFRLAARGCTDFSLPARP